MKSGLWKNMLAIATLCGYTVGAGPSGLGATNKVEIVDFGFNPTNLQVNVGDTVSWNVSAENYHTYETFRFCIEAVCCCRRVNHCGLLHRWNHAPASHSSR